MASPLLSSARTSSASCRQAMWRSSANCSRSRTNGRSRRGSFILRLCGKLEQPLPQRGARAHDGVENPCAERDERGGFGSDGGQTPTTVPEQCAPPKMIARPKRPNHRAGSIAQFDASGFHHVKRERWFARVEKGIARFEMDVLERLRVARRDERDVAWEKKVERPVDDHAQLAVEPRQLRQIDGAPHPPGEKAGELHAHDLGDRSAMTDRSE